VPWTCVFPTARGPRISLLTFTSGMLAPTTDALFWLANLFSTYLSQSFFATLKMNDAKIILTVCVQAPRVRSSPPKPISRLTKSSGSLPFPATSQLLLQPVAVLHVTRVAGGDKLLTSGDTLCDNVEAMQHSSVTDSLDTASAALLAGTPSDPKHFYFLIFS
jgi:hypothetical protein